MRSVKQKMGMTLMRLIAQHIGTVLGTMQPRQQAGRQCWRTCKLLRAKSTVVAAAREPELGEPSIPAPIVPVGTITLADDYAPQEPTSPHE